MPGAPLTRAVSGFVGWLARLPAPPAVWIFARLARIDRTEMAGRLADYRSVQALFVRRLRPGVRPVDRRQGVLVSPADGTFVQGGPVGPDTTIAVKGRRLAVSELLAGTDVEPFAGGSFALVYLSPRDYHRVHAPAEGEVVQTLHVRGALYPVNDLGLRWIPRVFVRNERRSLVVRNETFGWMAWVLVGSTNVGSVVLEPETDESVVAGQEIGRFELGSSVLVFSQRPVRFDRVPGSPVRYGESLGFISS